MRGILRPSRRRLGPELHDRWMAHLCGGCLTLRAVSGQASRAVTSYDALLLSVVVEAQTGALGTVGAGPCPLRGMRTARVVTADEPAMRAVAAVGLLGAAGGLEDKRLDRDLPVTLRRPAGVAARWLEDRGRSVAAEVGLDPAALLAAPAAAATVEASGGHADLEQLLAPAGRAAADLLGQAAGLGGRPANSGALAAAGDAFGRLAHLLDAVDDRVMDARRGRFNPLAATGTSDAEAGRLAGQLLARMRRALSGAELVDRRLLDALLAELAHGLHHRFHLPQPSPTRFASLAAVIGLAGLVGGAPGGPPREPCFCRRCWRGCDCGDCCADACCEGCCDLDCCDCCDCAC